MRHSAWISYESLDNFGFKQALIQPTNQRTNKYSIGMMNNNVTTLFRQQNSKNASKSINLAKNVLKNRETNAVDTCTTTNYCNFMMLDSKTKYQLEI